MTRVPRNERETSLPNTSENLSFVEDLWQPFTTFMSAIYPNKPLSPAYFSNRRVPITSSLSLNRNRVLASPIRENDEF